MILPDVNVLVFAHRDSLPDHPRYRAWMDDVVNGDEAYGISDFVLSSFIRIVTNARVFSPPATLEVALTFAEQIRSAPNCVRIEPGRRHWEIFTGLCRAVGARGYLIPDAYLAALAIESGSEWITTDRDFGRFPGLRWRHPLG